MGRKGLFSIMTMVLLSMCLMTGCGQSHASTGTQGIGGQDKGNSGTSSGGIQTWIDVKQTGSNVEISLNLKNQTQKEKTLHFNTGKRFDFIVKDAQGKKVHQHSDGQMYNQMAGTETIKPEKVLSYKGKVSGLKKGKYTVTFWLATKKKEPKVTRSFQVQ